MARYEIHGGAPLNGSVTISGAKNAVVAILPAALLVSGPCRIENVPDISDVRILLDILRGMGATIEKPEDGVVVIDCSGVTEAKPDETLVRKMRASYYLMGALLGRFGHAHVVLKEDYYNVSDSFSMIPLHLLLLPLLSCSLKKVNSYIRRIHQSKRSYR